MTIIASPMVVAVAGRIATWKVCCMTLVVSTGSGVTDSPIIGVVASYMSRHQILGELWWATLC